MFIIYLRQYTIFSVLQKNLWNYRCFFKITLIEIVLIKITELAQSVKKHGI